VIGHPYPAGVAKALRPTIVAIRVVAHLIIGGAGVNREAVHHPLEVLPAGGGARVVVLPLQAVAVSAREAYQISSKLSSNQTSS